MKYLGLIWRNAWRKKIRTSLTLLSVLVAFLMFSLLYAIGEAFASGGATIESARRLVVIDKISLINPLPMAYQNKIEAIPGVDKVAHASWFGGYYQDQKNQFGQFPIPGEEYLELYPEFDMPEEQRQAFLNNRVGAIVGSTLAEKYGWQVGDRIPIYSTIWAKKDGSHSWEFDLEGIFTNTSSGGSDAMMLFHFDYFDEARQFGQGIVQVNHMIGQYTWPDHVDLIHIDLIRLIAQRYQVLVQPFRGRLGAGNELHRDPRLRLEIIDKSAVQVIPYPMG